jgi:hypothetical protein
MTLATTPLTKFEPLGVVTLRADVYPANVAFSWEDGVTQKARVIVTADKIIVLVDGQGAPGVLYEGRLEDVVGDRKTLQATTADGTVSIQRGGGCGCGSKLKTYKPYKRAVRMATR